MKIRKGTAFVAIVLALTLSAVAFGAGQRRNQQQQQQRGQEAGQQPQSIGPQATSKDELDGFVALQNEQNPATKVTMADAFVSKFPNSDFVGYAHILKMMALTQTGKPKEAALAGEQALEATVKFGEKLFAKADAGAEMIARLQSGVLGSIKQCTGAWCRLVGSGFDGWVAQERLWGVYPNEKVE